MKRIEVVIFTIPSIIMIIGTVLSTILLCGIFTACNAQNNTSVALKPVTSNTVTTVQEKAVITAVTLSELVGSTDEIECFAFYFDIKPEVLTGYTDERGVYIPGLLEDHRILFIDDLQNAGYKPTFTTDDNNYIYFNVPFDNNGNIIPWSDFIDPDKHEWELKEPRIIGRHPEKTVFDYDID